MRILIISTCLLISSCSSISEPYDEAERLEEDKRKIVECQALREEIDELKGKPIRRGARMEYYEKECLPE